MGIRLAKSLEAFELKTILLRWRRFRAASFFGMARDELFRRARAMANSSWRAFWRGFGYCLRQYAFARALSSVGNTRTFARYRLRRYARIVWLRGLRLLPAAYCLRQYAFARALSPVGNTRTFARYRLRRYARIVGLRGLWKRCRAKKFLVDFGKAISEKNSGERLADDGNGCA